MAAIEVKNLSKTFQIPKTQPGLKGAVRSLFHREYTPKEAVKDVSFSLEGGEMVGYIGPNGAGKSTTIKMLCGILMPDGGSVRVHGLDPWKQRRENARQIGVVFGQRSQLYWDLPVSDTLELYQKLYDIPMDVYRRNRERFIDLLEMGEFISQPVRQLSLGQKMKANLALALLHGPRVIYLDEPTIGLDVMTKRRLRAFIGEINRESGTTVILTTHDMKDIEEICKRLILIDKGSLLYDGSLSEFRHRYAQGARYRLEFEHAPAWTGREGFECRPDGENWILTTRRPHTRQTLISLIEDYNPTNIFTEEITIEDIVSALFTKQPQAAS